MGLMYQSQTIYIRYWLNELSAEEREALEEQYFTEDTVFEAVLAAKQQLIHDFCRQRLSLADRQRFEQHLFVSPADQLEVQLLQGLLAQECNSGKAKTVANGAAKTSEPWWRWFLPANSGLAWGRLAAVSASLVFVLGIGSWFYFRSTTNPVTAVLTSEPTTFGQQESLLALLPETMESGARGTENGAIATATLSQEVGALRLRLSLPTVAATACRVEILDLESKSIVWQSSLALTASQKEAEVLVQRNVLPLGDYRLILFNAGQTNPAVELARYQFAIRTQ